MKTADAFRVSAGVAGILVSCIGLTGCLGSPTYGTDKTAVEQLADDLGSAVSIQPKAGPNKSANYNPRPELLMPPAQASAELVKPQDSLANSESNPEWVEAPEQTRERLVAEADAHKDDPNYRSPLLVGYGSAGTKTESEKWQDFREARKIQQGAYLDQRRFLADPPVAYREVTDPAELDDLGEPELKKEKRRKQEAKAAKQSSSWWLPFQN